MSSTPDNKKIWLGIAAILLGIIAVANVGPIMKRLSGPSASQLADPKFVMSKVLVGQTAEQVQNILGEPEHTQGGEAEDGSPIDYWYYGRVQISLSGGRVTAIVPH